MQIIPAIDLYDGQCIRLQQGEFDRRQQYASDPVAIAQDYATTGATQIHIVDLNGAESGEVQQLETILKIQAQANIPLQVGGGLRTIASIEKYLQHDIDRVVIGSLAVRDPASIIQLIEKYGVARFVIAIDVRISDEPYIATHGWKRTSQTTLWDLLIQYQPFDKLNILCTDIDRDGMLTGPNVEFYQQVHSRFPNLCLQASGGVSCLQDLSQLKSSGLSAAIIGKALYEKKFTLAEALAC